MEMTKWLLSLKPGDLVCDCRYQHRKIARITDVHEPDGNWAMCAWVVAMFSVDAAVVVNNALCRTAGKVVIERVVFFQDGSSCRAGECLSPPAACQHS